MRQFPPTSSNVKIITAVNATFQDAFQFDDESVTTWNFSGKTFRMDIKRSYEDTSALLSFTSASGKIVVDDVTKRILHFNVPEATFAGIPPGCYYYDLIMTDTDSIRTPLMHGTFVLADGITGG